LGQRDDSKYVICSVCHRPNRVGKTYCQYCWSQIRSTVEIDSEEARETLHGLEKNSRRRKKIRLWSFILGPLILVATLSGVILVGYTDILIRPPLTLNSNSPAGQWAMFHHDLLHSGSSGSGDTLPEGKLLWTFSTGREIQSSPAIVDSVAYVGSRNGKIYAINLITGTIQWEYQTGSWVDSSPVVMNGVVYFGSNDGSVYALDAISGKKLWSFQTPYPIRSSVAVAGGAVYFGGDDYYIYALNVQTGEMLWRFWTDGLVVSSVAVNNGIVYVGSEDGFLYALDARNGRFRLRFRSALITTSPAVNGNTVYFCSSNGYLYAINGRSRNWPFEYDILPYWIQLWGMGVAPKPPEHSGFIWQMKLGTTIWSSPTIQNSTLYVGVDDSLVAIDIQTHKILWSFKTGGVIESSPAVNGNIAYIGSDDGKIYAIDATSGKGLWNFSTQGPIGSSPAIFNGVLYVGSYDGLLYAIK